jgi:hypothetical protein
MGQKAKRGHSEKPTQRKTRGLAYVHVDSITYAHIDSVDYAHVLTSSTSTAAARYASLTYSRHRMHA